MYLGPKHVNGSLMAVVLTAPHPPPLSLATFETDESRWAAVVARSPEADGHFYFCVSSTSIFCRPSCPSRRPDRRNVVFVTTIPAAHAAGYRACKRCTPEDDVGLAEQHQLEAVEKVKAIIGGCVGRGERVPGLDTLAGEVRMSKFHLQRVFKKREGISPKQYASACGGRSVSLPGFDSTSGIVSAKLSLEIDWFISRGSGVKTAGERRVKPDQ